MRRTVLLLASLVLVVMLISGVALAVTKIGTDGPDALVGTKGSDKLLGKGGSDRIEGRGGEDIISGGPGNDGPLVGGVGADIILGGPGDDLMFDHVFFNEGAEDKLMGGDGKDQIRADNRPAARDIVDCGAGRDGALVDRKDIVSDCETIDRD